LSILTGAGEERSAEGFPYVSDVFNFLHSSRAPVKAARDALSDIGSPLV
jgi:hypothetical protein